MRILVCGGSKISIARVTSVLDEIHDETPIYYVAAGSGSGADAHALAWADAAGIDWERFPADFDPPGVEGYTWAGRVVLFAQPHRVVVFPGYEHTRWMLAAAKAAGLPHQVIPPE